MLHAEDLRLSGEIDETLRKTSVTGGAIAMATLLLVHADAADVVEPMRADIGDQGGVSAICSSAGNRLVARAESGMTLRCALIPAITRCNRFLISAGHGLPKLWTI